MGVDWDGRYRADELPWDTGVVEPLLVQGVEGLRPGRALEIGCGTGTNALWLAEAGFDVVALDLSPTAIQRARDKAAGRAAAPRFLVHDLIASPLSEGGFDLVFDCGVFHVFDEAEHRRTFVDRVADALKADGTWLSLIGAAEGSAREVGPPRRTAREVVEAVEPCLRIRSLRLARFEHIGAPAWVLKAAPRPSRGSRSREMSPRA